MTAGASTTAERIEPGELAGTVAGRVANGSRFAGLVAWAEEDSSTLLRVLLASRGGIDVLECELPPGVTAYPSLTPLLPAAAWYERELRDLHGLVPIDHPRPVPLVLPLAGDEPWRPRPGGSRDGLGRPVAGSLEIDPSPLPAHVAGEGMFTIPYGPVRSGVFESLEYLVESYGEDIAHLRTRVHYKHRGVDDRFCDLDPEDAVLVAERVEGTASAAHALALSQALETLTGVAAPPAASLLRLVHAELERVACHLDSMIRHTEGAGQAVAYARMSLHKERLMRLRAQLCGHRFSRGVIVPGGVTGEPLMVPGEALAAVNNLEVGLGEDCLSLMATPSFLDRLRGTGVLPPPVAAAHGALGPVGRGSGQRGDVRVERPYGAYELLGFEPAEPREEGDALSRQAVRLEEISGAFHLVRQALDELEELGEPDGPAAWRAELPAAEGFAVSSVEAPQGELVYAVEASGGRLTRVKARTASFHNLALLPDAFRGDILTDFVFIEASFGLSIAGVAG